MQPIHSTACFGQLNAMTLLIEKYGVDPQEKADVRVTEDDACLSSMQLTALILVQLY